MRMFVIPYDFRDMPAMSQTFIRQRVLACNDGNGVKHAEQLSTAEQMKLLRYAIHLRSAFLFLDFHEIYIKILSFSHPDSKRVVPAASAYTPTSNC